MAAHAALLEAVDQVGGAELEARRQASRRLKNLLIGSAARKSVFLDRGALDPLMSMLQAEAAAEVLVEAIPALGSMAHGRPHHVRAVRSPAIVSALFDKLSHPNHGVVTCAARALRAILSSRTDEGSAATPVSMLREGVVDKLVRLMAADGTVPLSAVTILASCCRTTEQKQWILDRNGVEKLLPLLERSDSDRRRVHCVLSALGALTRDSEGMAAAVCSATLAAPGGVKEPLPVVLLQLAREPAGDSRVLAARCLTNIHREGLQLPGVSPRAQLLPTVLNIVKDVAKTPGSCPSTVFEIFTRLVEEDENLQCLAAHQGVVGMLAKRIDPSRERSADVRNGALSALAAMASKSASARKEVVKNTKWGHVLDGLTDPAAVVRRGAAKFVLSASRSVRILRTSMVESSLAEPLCKLLEDVDHEVRVHAAAAMCNFVMEFSPVKKMAMDLGVIQKLVQGTHAVEGDFRLNCIWGLKNLLFEADSPNGSVTKSRVMDAIGWPHLRKLIDDAAPDVQEQALGTLRNLVYGSMTDVENTVRWCGGREVFYGLLSRKMMVASPRCREQVLYILCNATASATSTVGHKDFIVELPELLQHIMGNLLHADRRVVVAALWCTINLAWAESPGAPQRQLILLNLDVLGTLRTLLTGPDLDVKDRSKTMLEQFYSCGNVPHDWTEL